MSKSLTVTICKGLPASGKTTWAKEQVLKSQGHTKRINKDDLRAMLDAGKWSKQNERYIIHVRNILIRDFLESGYNIIIDDTNLAKKHITDIRKIVDNHNEFTEGEKYQTHIKDFTDVSPQKCIERDNKRANGVGHKVILDMYNKYIREQETAVKPPEYNSNLPDCIICDIDGTLSDNNWRNPFDASEANKDKLIESTYEILYRFANYDCELTHNLRAKIILFSGRDNSFLIPTLKFLEKYNVPYDSLHLRSAGDTRKDSIVKREMYENFVKNKYNVLFVLDDRDQVVDMWRNELGLPCHQVNYGNF